MKESLKKITAWIKAHPIPAAIIGIVVVVVGYFVVKSSGGNSSGESIDGGSLGADEASPLVGLGGGDMSTGSSTTSTGTTPESIPTSTGATTPAYNDISTPSAAESIATYGTPSDYVNESAIFSGPTPAADVFNNVQKMTLAESGFTKSIAAAPTSNKNYGAALVSTNTGQPVKPLTRLGIASTLSNLSTPIKAPSLASIKPVVTKPTPYTAPKPSVNTIFTNALTKPATPRFNVLKYVGNVSGYKWDSKLKRYVRLTSTAQPLKAY